MAEWQTRQLEGLLGISLWRFKSSRPHHYNRIARGSGSVVEHLLAKERVASSNLVFRSQPDGVARADVSARSSRRGTSPRATMTTSRRRSQVVRQGSAKSRSPVRIRSSPLFVAEVAEWQTRQSQKLLGGDPRVGSTPTFGTAQGTGIRGRKPEVRRRTGYLSSVIRLLSSGTLPSGVTVTHQTLDLVFKVRILARQPPQPPFVGRFCCL